MSERGHELVLHGHDAGTGLRTIVAIHSTALGPALGGTRFHPYPSESAALADALRLAQGMTLKAAAADLPLGGGKAVILGDPRTEKTTSLLRAYGRVVSALGGRYITAEDVGTTVEDMLVVRETSRWVTGLPREEGGSGDPSPMTAAGVVAAMRAVAAHLWGSESLAGRRVAIQGVGKVGAALARLLRAESVRLVVADVDRARARSVATEISAEVVDAADVLEVPCDILAPCALGGVLSEATIPRLRCRAVVGSANNQLATDDDADQLAAAGILYAPDFVVNAGGLINIAVELAPGGYDQEVARRRVDAIGDRVRAVLETAARDGATPTAAATAQAQARVRAARETGAGTPNRPSSGRPPDDASCRGR